MGNESVRPKPGGVEVSGDFPAGDRSVSEERQRQQPWRGPKPKEEEYVAPSPELHAEQRIAGKYRLKRPIGEGGMGRVWIAHNEDLDVDVAMKVLRPEARKSVRAQVSERMLVEARAAARLGHPAIVRVLDLGRTDDGDPFLVMELLEGENLADVVETRGPLEPVEAVRTLLPIAHAMMAAHEKGIIHRDLKPENIILSVQQGGAIQPKLIDFGVAKLAAEGADRITQIGMLVGSPGYMSPEQGRGDPVDARSDVWSFCIVLHELVTGHVPFRKNHPYAILRAILEDPLPDLEQAGFTDEALAIIVRRGLEKAPADRWQSMNELGVTLARWLLDKGVFDDICGASLDVSWLRPRTPSLPEDLASFRERSPSLGALARMRSPTSDAPGESAPSDGAASEWAPRPSKSEGPVSFQALPVWKPTQPSRKTSFGIAIAAVSIALVALSVAAYVRFYPPSAAIEPAPASKSPTVVATPAEPHAAPVVDENQHREDPDDGNGAPHDTHPPKKTPVVMKPGASNAGASSAVKPALSASAPPVVSAPAPTPTSDPSPLKRPEL